MTYDDAVNTIVERYRNGEFPGWTMTDPDSAQMRRDRGSGLYEFVELIDAGDVLFSHDTIDLDNFTEKGLWAYFGSIYYENEHAFKNQGPEIAAECIFESARYCPSYGSPDEMLKLYLKIVKEE